MIIQHQDDRKQGVFFIEENGIKMAEMVYRWSETGQLIIQHTEVDESLKGQGIGKQLVQQGVAFAREKHCKIVPLCVFAKSILQKTPAYQDVLS